MISVALLGCGGEGNGGGASGASAKAAATSSSPSRAAVSHDQSSNPATAILVKMGRVPRLQFGLGAGQSIDDMKAQGIHPDIIDTYLVGVGSGSWPYWNTDGAYVTYTAQKDLAYGATPMFTLYQMASKGDGNLGGINDQTFMNTYWSQVRLMYERINDLDTPVLVNLEPDFWGYVYAQAPHHDAAQMPAVVNNQPECSWMPNTAAGIGMCLVSMGRWHAPKALLGFPPAFWNASPDVIAKEMQAVGADRADFIVAQTSDRDAGCLEAAAVAECTGRTGPFYRDENNIDTPNFHQEQGQLSTYRAALGNGLPILWWQTPLGVPSNTPGGTPGHYRDDHADYMLKYPWEYGGISTFAIVFSGGGTYSTSIKTDGGQFARLFGHYLSYGGVGVK
ncbi:MAG TPA: hypothetical protein VHC91_08490 [Trinickia sp.]|uniref:hypothetical protein n=1 Tax=Trinickia sp. TaxID=2571163 RepID=UPI002C87D7BE|nr:hypothetical protein [Trinickia sp.]HVW50432.1 hypothetical protein [Trinickia sp.]